MNAVFAFRAMKARAEAAEREVARLTKSLAAERRATGAEADIEEGRDPLEAARAIRSELVQVHDELLAAERDRDAARALLRRIYDWQGPHGFTVTVMNDIKAHLSGQPAAPACACGHPEDSGKHGASMCEIDEDDQRETAPTPHEAHSCDWFGRFTCRICGKHRDEPAAPARDVESRCAACDQRLDASSDRDSYHSALLSSPTGLSVAADPKRGAAWATVNTKHNGVMLSVDDLREQLAAQGLNIVTAADKAVLDHDTTTTALICSALGFIESCGVHGRERDSQVLLLQEWLEWRASVSSSELKRREQKA